MAEKPPAFTVTDRRKFTADGDIREGAPAEETSAPQAPPPAAQVSANVAEAVHPAPGQFGANIAVHPAPGQFGANVAEAVHPAPGQFGARVVTMPAPPAPAPSAPAAPTTPPADLHDEVEGGEDVDEGDALPEPTDAESAEQQAAYRESSQQLDEMIRQSNPGMKAAGAVTIEHVLQSIYLSAVVAMGAAAEPGQKPRIDIVGARQSIDMLSVLEEKTRGNLNEKEQRLLQSMLFEVRMMFLEITNAIAHQAQNPPPIKK
jgi:hypothetical protein